MNKATIYKVIGTKCGKYFLIVGKYEYKFYSRHYSVNSYWVNKKNLLSNFTLHVRWNSWIVIWRVASNTVNSDHILIIKKRTIHGYDTFCNNLKMVHWWSLHSKSSLISPIWHPWLRPLFLMPVLQIGEYCKLDYSIKKLFFLLISISLQPDCVNRWYFKLNHWTHHSSMGWNIKNLQHQAAMIVGRKNWYL